MYQLNPFTRMLNAMLSTELQCVKVYQSAVLLLTVYLMFSGLQIRCKPDEFAVFNPPSSQSCATWANDFVDAFGGYVENPSDTQACRYCRYKVSLAWNLRYLNAIRPNCDANRLAMNI